MHHRSYIFLWEGTCELDSCLSCLYLKDTIEPALKSDGLGKRWVVIIRAYVVGWYICMARGKSGVFCRFVD